MYIVDVDKPKKIYFGLLFKPFFERMPMPFFVPLVI